MFSSTNASSTTFQPECCCVCDCKPSITAHSQPETQNNQQLSLPGSCIPSSTKSDTSANLLSAFRPPPLICPDWGRSLWQSVPRSTVLGDSTSEQVLHARWQSCSLAFIVDCTSTYLGHLNPSYAFHTTPSHTRCSTAVCQWRNLRSCWL
jgi:hypothetical protein